MSVDVVYCEGTKGLKFDIDLRQEKTKCGTKKIKVHDKNETSIHKIFKYDPVYIWNGTKLSTCENAKIDPNKKQIEVTITPTKEYRWVVNFFPSKIDQTKITPKRRVKRYLVNMYWLHYTANIYDHIKIM